jgi:hypothetical protein
MPDTLIEIWTGLKSYIPSKDQKAAAEHLIELSNDIGLVEVNSATVDCMFGQCDVFDVALSSYCDDNGIASMWDIADE